MRELLYPSLSVGCVGAWCPSRDSSRSTLLLDRSGNGKHGTLTNMDTGTDWVASGSGVALDFDGSNDYVTIPFAIAYPLTIAIWCLAQTATSKAVIEVSSQSANDGWGISVNNSGAVAIGSANGANTFNVAIKANEWNHYCFVCESATNRMLYVNGALGETTATNRTPAVITAVLLAAQYNYGSYSAASCLLDDVRIYSRVITPSEIKTLAQRRGIAYETRRSTRAKAAATAATSRRNNILMGCGF